MSTITVEKINEVYLRVSADWDVCQELSESFKFRVPGYQYMPSYRAGWFDGFIHLFNQRGNTLYAGLYNELLTWARDREYEVDFKPNNYYDYPFQRNQVPIAKIQDFINFLNPTGNDGKPLEVRDYQIAGIEKAINDSRTVLVSPTGSGKSLMIYILLRWYLSLYTDKAADNIMILVPTTSLVEQMYSDFETYSQNDPEWKVEDYCQKLYAGFDKNLNKRVMISTWQSVYKLPRPFFRQFVTVFGDEAHKFKAKMLTSLMEKMDNVPFRIGTTGTLDNHAIHQLVLEGLFGPVFKVTTTKDLMEKKQLAELTITCLLLQYPDAVCKLMKRHTWQQEMDWLIANDDRNIFIRNLALSTTGNTLVLFQYVEKHGKKLFELINEKSKGSRPVLLVTGKTETEVREEIRKYVETVNNAIIIASYGVFSQGINIPSLENIIFASPSKSKIRNLQSIGRGLRTSENKQTCNLYDVADDLHWKAHKNHTLKHFLERIKIYSEEQFKFRTIEVQMK